MLEHEYYPQQKWPVSLSDSERYSTVLSHEFEFGCRPMSRTESGGTDDVNSKSTMKFYIILYFSWLLTFVKYIRTINAEHNKSLLG